MDTTYYICMLLFTITLTLCKSKWYFRLLVNCNNLDGHLNNYTSKLIGSANKNTEKENVKINGHELISINKDK